MHQYIIFFIALVSIECLIVPNNIHLDLQYDYSIVQLHFTTNL